MTDGATTGLRMDGDLIHDVVLNACPDVLTDEAARAVAERALASLAAIPGVTVLRGPDSRPWPQPRHPQTKVLTLCRLEGRKGGRVTVGDSRLPAAPVLGLIRAHGVEEARLMWPQLTADELAVLAQLAADLTAEDDDDE